MAYPDTRLRDDMADDDFGGATAVEFGGRAWAWVNAVLVFLGRAYLTYARVPWSTIVVVSDQAATAGQVAVFAPTVVTVGRAYVVTPYKVTIPAPKVVGIYLEPCSVGATARVATTGVIPPTVTGLGPPSSAADVGLDAATGRVRVAVAGDVVLGRIDVQGNVHFTGYGSAV